MCPNCSKAPTCRDLLHILKAFSFEEKKSEDQYFEMFPFMKKPPSDSTVDPKNKLNELTSGEWLSFTRTVLSGAFPKIFGHALRRKHPEYKSPFLMGQLISFFTKTGDIVLDPFAGTGTSLVAASLLGREAIGFEIQKKWCEIYYEICNREDIQKQKLVQGHCVTLAGFVPPESLDFVIMDPPNPLKPDDWSDPDLDSPHAPVDAFFNMFHELVKTLRVAMKWGKYAAIFTRNIYQDGHYVYMTPMFAAAAEDAGLTLKGEKIWENKAEKMRPFGYPHSYIPNVVHYNILIFQKTK